MANQKYDNLNVLLAQGKLNWSGDVIKAVLLQGASFTAAHTKLSEVGTEINSCMMTGRYVDETGAMYGNPAVFDAVDEGTGYQVVLCKYVGASDPDVLAWFDVDDAGNGLEMSNHGTFLLRPVVNGTPTQGPLTGIWLKA